MPPKPAAKKGKEDELDFSDVPTLPPLNSINFSVLYRLFKSEEQRKELQKYVHEHFQPDRVKTLTREEVITYGKSKQHILEPALIATLPQDDPRLKMTEVDQLAKAFSEKLFELSVYARRAKKEKIVKIEEEQKLQQQSDPNVQINPYSVIDVDGLDIMFQLIDFPASVAEANAFAKINQTLNILAIVDTTQQNEQTIRDGGVISPARIFDYKYEITEDFDSVVRDETNRKIKALQDARQQSSKHSSLRNMMIQTLEFFDFNKNISDEEDSAAEGVVDEFNMNANFFNDFQQNLERIGAMFIKYHRFKERVNQLPLVPDRAAIDQIESLKSAQNDYNGYVQQNENICQILNSTQKDSLSTDDKEAYEQVKQQYLTDKPAMEQEELDRKQKLEQLQSRLKVSVDDEKTDGDYPQDIYNKNFIDHKNSQNHVASILSSMVSQLSGIDLNQSMVSDASLQEVPLSEAEQLEKVFQDYKDSTSIMLNQKEPPITSNYQIDESRIQSRLRKAGTESLSYQHTEHGDVEYNEEVDISKKALQKLPKLVTNSEEDRAEDICLREKNMVSNLVLPGVNRHLMPAVSSKSERLRKFEKPSLYPFCTLPIEDAERCLLMKAFQELMKSNFIDEGKNVDEKHNKYRIFERNYQSHMNQDILKQVLAEAFLSDPDVATLYYPRDDALLLALYNKVKLDKKPVGDVDGEKSWRAAYRVMPDFENFVKFFADELFTPAQVKEGQPPKFQLDEEMLPETLLDIDDQKIQNVGESSQMLYPEDNSVMRVDSFTVGGQTYKKAVITKDNLTFGLRPAYKDNSPVPENEKEYGLVSYKPVGDTEFWLHFENYTKLTVEVVQRKRNPQKLIRVDPPKPTPEELAERAEQIKAQQAQIAKNKGKIPAGMVIIEEYKEPEPTWVEELPSELDALYNDVDFNSNIESLDKLFYCSISTLSNGLIVKHYSSGEICQTTQDQICNNESEELDRVVLPSGIVIRHLRNKNIECLYPNGQISFFDRKELMWITTNNKGLRRAKKQGIEWDLDPIPCAYETDAVSEAKMMVREDNVISIQFKDGSLYTQHADGTMIWSGFENNTNKIRIEKENYATIVSSIYDTNCYEDMQALYNLNQNAFQYSGPVYVVETLLPDGSVVQSTKSKFYQEGPYWNHKFLRSDYSVVNVNSVGIISILSSNARSSINEIYSNVRLGQDQDYNNYIHWDENNDNKVRFRGVYYAQLIQKGNPLVQPYIQTPNADGSQQYTLTADLSLVREDVSGYQLVGFDPLDNLSIPMREVSGLKEDGREIEDTYGPKNPLIKNYITPRLFIIKSDGSGYEMMSKEQLEYYFRVLKNRKESTKQRRIINYGLAYAKTHYFVTKVKNHEDQEHELSRLNSLNFPSNAQYALLKNKYKALRSERPLHVVLDQYLFRQIFEFQDFEDFKQEAFYNDLSRYKSWKMSQVRYETEFGITWVPVKDQVIDYRKIEDDEYCSKRIITKILKERRSNRRPFDPEEYKLAFLAEIDNDQEMTNFYKRLLPGGKGDEKALMIQESGDIERTHSNLNKYDKTQDENWRAKKKNNAQNKVKQIISDIQKMVNTPTFLANYFKCQDGATFTKNHPEKAPSQEMIMRMSQRIHRSQQNSEKAQSQFDGQSQKSSPHGKQEDGNQDQIDDKDNPIVALEPEDQFKQGSAFMGSKRKSTMNENPLAMASLYLQEKIYMKQREQEHLLKAEEYHVVKTKDFNVVGRLRQEKQVVKATQKSQAQSDLNEKFITTECIADRRVKISSMAQRQYVNAPSVQDVRKQGQHQMILSAINKKQTFAELINQANSMVTGVLHDPLKRSVNIMPSKVDFGQLKKGQRYEVTLTIKNEDHLPQRVVIQPIRDNRIKVEAVNTGAIAPGMMMKVVVSIVGSEGTEGQIKETLKISTKTDVFKIPIEANLMEPDNYDEAEREAYALQGKGVANPRVREKMEAIKQGRWWNESDAFPENILQSQDNTGERRTEGRDSAPPKQWQDKVDNAKKGRWWRDQGAFRDGFPTNQQDGKGWIETTQSESKLPQIPQIDKRPFDVDPKKPLKDILKK